MSVSEIFMHPDSLHGRFFANFRLKLVLALLLNAIVLSAYAWAQHFPSRPVTMMPVTMLDRMIPYDPDWALLYLSLNLLTPFGFFSLRCRAELIRYTLATLYITAVAVGVFVAFPTACVRPECPAEHAILCIIACIDLPLNACPSLHAAFAVLSWFSFWWAIRRTRYASLFGAPLAIWVILILYSTLATRQHVVLDLVAGVALGVSAIPLITHAFPSEHP